MNDRMHRLVMVFGGIGIVAFLYVVLGFMLLPKGGLQKQREARWKQETAVQGDPTNFPTVKGKMSEPIDLKAALAPTEESLEKGKTLFATNCVACHGAQGRGDGPAAAALTPKPRNFTSPDGWTNGHTLTDIFRTVSKGVPGSSMAAFDTLSEMDRFALSHYVQFLGRFDHGQDTPAQVAALDKEFSLSTGAQEPNRVAVWRVMKNMAADYRPAQALAMPGDEAPGEGARLCRTLVSDPGRLAQVLAQVPDWRANVDALIRLASADPRGCGLDPAVVTLNAGQWKALHAQLVEACTPASAPGKKA